MRRRSLAVLVPALLAVAVGLPGCGNKSTFTDRTARVTVSGRTTELTVDSCGRDDRTVFVVARSDDGQVLQEVVGLKADRKTAVPRATGFTLLRRDGDLGAFGKVSWVARGESGTPPGTITSARLIGARIQVGAIAQPIDEHDQPTTGDRVDV